MPAHAAERARLARDRGMRQFPCGELGGAAGLDTMCAMAFVSVGTDVELYYEDYGSGRPVVLIHGWPLSGRSWEWQVPVLVDAGYRVVTYDRRGFGRSSRPWTGYDFDTFAADLRALVDHVDLTDATLVGFSMGGGEVARYLSTYGSQRVSQAVFAGAVPPYIHKTAANPDGWLDDTTIAGFHAGIRGDRIAFLEALFVEYFAAAGRNDLASTSITATWRRSPPRRQPWTAWTRSPTRTSGRTWTR